MRAIPHSQLAMFPDGDHFLLFTRSAGVVETFTAFFDGPADGGR
jgi:hypothetical protein